MNMTKRKLPFDSRLAELPTIAFSQSDTDGNGTSATGKTTQRPTAQSARTLRQIIEELPLGSWLALSMNRKRVVGKGSTANAARRMARAEGEKEVILLRVPDKMNTGPDPLGRLVGYRRRGSAGREHD